MSELSVRIGGVSKLETKEFADEKGITFAKDVVPEDSHGEPILFTAVFAMSALTALAAYLLRKHDNQSFEEEIEILHPDGRVEKKRLKYYRDKTEAPAAAVLRQIRGMF